MNYTLTIHPTYICNFDCHFCHQNDFGGDENSFLKLDLLREVLKTIKEPINRIVLMGGEVSVLPDKYLKELLEIVEAYNVPISTQTNLYKINPLLLKHSITVSYDFENRPKYDVVFGNMLMLEEFDITTVVSKNILRKDIKELFGFYSSLKGLRNLKFLPQKMTEASQDQSPTVEQFTDFVNVFQKLNPKFNLSQRDSKYQPDKDIIVTPTGEVFMNKWHGTQIEMSSICYQCSERDRCDIKGLVMPTTSDCKYKKIFLNKDNK